MLLISLNKSTINVISSDPHSLPFHLYKVYAEHMQRKCSNEATYDSAYTRLTNEILINPHLSRLDISTVYLSGHKNTANLYAQSLRD